MTIPLIGFLYLYLLFLFAWLIFSVIALYHIIKYGQIGFVSLMSIAVYLAVSAALLSLSYQFLSQIDWSVGLTIFQGGVNPFGSTNF